MLTQCVCPLNVLQEVQAPPAAETRIDLTFHSYFILIFLTEEAQCDLRCHCHLFLMLQVVLSFIIFTMLLSYENIFCHLLISLTNFEYLTILNRHLTEVFSLSPTRQMFLH